MSITAEQIHPKLSDISADKAAAIAARIAQLKDPAYHNRIAAITEARKRPVLRPAVQRKVQAVGSRSEKTARCKPTGKVGSELAALLKQLGIDSKWCSTGCNGYSKLMNAWGCDGCRQRRAEIVQRLEQQQRAAGWSVTAKAAGMALVSGIAFEIDLTDPLGWLVDEAVRRAEAAEKCGNGGCEAS